MAYATDTWTNPQMVYTFACTLGSFIDDDWNLIEQVVDFAPLQDQEHKGHHAAHAFVKGAASRGGMDKISNPPLQLKPKLMSRRFYYIATTTDNASVNDTIVEVTARLLEKRYNVSPTADQHIRCADHVVNLVAQKFLHVLCEAEDPDVADDYNVHKDAPRHYDPTEDPDQVELEQERDVEGAEEVADEDDKDELAREVLRDAVNGLKNASPLKRVRDQIISVLFCNTDLLLAAFPGEQDRLIATEALPFPQGRCSQVQKGGSCCFPERQDREAALEAHACT